MARRRRSSRIAVRRAVLAIGIVVLLLGVTLTRRRRLLDAPRGRDDDRRRRGGRARPRRRDGDAGTAVRRAPAPAGLVPRGRPHASSSRASQLGVRPDWESAVHRAAAAGDGFAPVRGHQPDPDEDLRLGRRARRSPSTRRSSRYTVGRIAAAVDRPAVDAVRAPSRARVSVAPDRSGPHPRPRRRGALIVAALADLERRGPVRLPLVASAAQGDAGPAREGGRRRADGALRARDPDGRPDPLPPPRWKVAELLACRAAARPRCDRRAEGRPAGSPPSPARSAAPPRDATFAACPAGSRSSRPARDARSTSRRPARRSRARPSRRRQDGAARRRDRAAGRTTAEAKAMGITGVVGSYTTTYGGTPGRVHNVASWRT